MLDWYLEDYIEFVTKCESNVNSIKKKIADQEGRTPPAGAIEWNNTILTIAKNQLAIAKYMAMQAGV